ncbi:FAD:protein FMN transferase [Microbacterium pullorum]|nr:FAD:protein FMN transferase [Microbacterium pullorum]
MPVSIHVRSRRDRPARGADAAVRECFEELRDIDRVFSTYRPDSDVSRIRAGELSIDDADPRVAVVAADCRLATVTTAGLFSAYWRGWFDPTGYVKGWAVENAARRHLAPLVEDDIAVGINAGGDLQLFTAVGADWHWTVGIADPRETGKVLATLDVADGAVATSGTAERGRHIIDPRTGRPATSVLSATVVADSLACADLWATTSVVAGFDDRSWVAHAGTRTGVVLSPDGRVFRWLGPTTVEVVPAAR